MSNTPGGIKPFLFANFDKSAPLEEFSFSKTAPQWRIVGRGLNLSGICKNKKCKAFEKSVVSRLGFGQFDLAFQIYNTPCPMCDKDIVKVHTADMYMTKLKVEGERVQNSSPESSSISNNNDDSTVNSENLTQMQKVIATTDKYTTFGRLEQQLVYWYYLTIETSQLKECKKGHVFKGYDQTECQICPRQIRAQRSSSLRRERR